MRESYAVREVGFDADAGTLVRRAVENNRKHDVGAQSGSRFRASMELIGDLLPER
jgi:hypothetical protein